MGRKLGVKHNKKISFVIISFTNWKQYAILKLFFCAGKRKESTKDERYN